MADDKPNEQIGLPGMPAMPPPDPPTLKNVAKLMQTVDQLYPSDTYGALGQWERFAEIADVAFQGGVIFVIPLADYHEMSEPHEAGDKVTD